MDENIKMQTVDTVVRKIGFLENLDYDNQSMDFNLQLEKMQKLTFHFTLKDQVLQGMYARNWFWRLWNKKTIDSYIEDYCEKAREININLEKLISLAKENTKETPK